MICPNCGETIPEGWFEFKEEYDRLSEEDKEIIRYISNRLVSKK